MIARKRIAVMLVVVATGCVQVPTTKSSHAPPDVKVTGSCLELDDGAKPMPEALALKVDEHLKAKRQGRADALVLRFPDVALQCGARVPFFASSAYPARYAAIEKELAASEADRKAGNEKSAIVHWHNAVGEFLAGASGPSSTHFVWTRPLPPPCDPNVAERIASIRPEKAPWPNDAIASALVFDLVRDEVLEESLDVVPNPLDSNKCKLSCESAYWLTVGHWRLERGEPKGALAALKKAETADTAGVALPWIQIQQAKAFLQLQQSPTAISILTGITGSPTAKLAALATLGACKFKDGHVDQALVLLKKAIEESPIAFPCRAEAEADLALAYLSSGDESAGIAHLHAAQKTLSETGRRSSHWLALENEATYLRHVGNIVAAAAVESRLSEDQSH